MAGLFVGKFKAESAAIDGRSLRQIFEVEFAAEEAGVDGRRGGLRGDLVVCRILSASAQSVEWRPQFSRKKAARNGASAVELPARSLASPEVPGIARNFGARLEHRAIGSSPTQSY